MTQKEHQVVIVGLLLVFSLPKSLLPIGIPTDRMGYDFGWFLCLFLVASYIRIYGIPFLEKKYRALAIYFVGVAGIWGISFLFSVLSGRGLPLAYAAGMPYCYNHILVLLAAVALFYVFKNIEMREGKVSRLICKISPYTLGVYLLHENLAIRTKWQIFAGVEAVRGKWSVIPHMMVTVLVVFLIGILVDFVRSCIFKKGYVIQNRWTLRKGK